MTNRIDFSQLIKTSSISRGGYRTYQATPDIHGDIEATLTGYGAYKPTVYLDMASMTPEDRPELFLFYHLPPDKTVVCKSVYLGLDLHSTPFRSGNYISHALITNSNIPFNPVEIYEKADWKTGKTVRQEENTTPPAPYHIQPIRIETDPDFCDPQWFTQLFTGPSNEEQENSNRQQMFKTAVDAIIQGKKIIIIDRRERLLSWTMSLLQAFPLEFVYRHLTIASFSNSQTLMGICNVLCVEPENTERIRRLAPNHLLIDIQQPLARKSSIYAEALTRSVMSDKFASFRNEVFPSIQKYAPERFDDTAQFYDRLNDIPDMKEDDFRQFLLQHIDKGSSVDRMFSILQKHKRIGHISILWQALLDKRPVTADDLSTWQQLKKYTVPGETDEQWIQLESQIAGRLAFTSLEQVNNLFRLTDSYDPRRYEMFFNIAVPIIGKTPELPKKEEGLIIVKTFILDHSGDQQQKYDEILQYLNLLNKIEMADPRQQYEIVFQKYPGLSGQQAEEVIRLLKPIGWKDVFHWWSSDIEMIRSIYNMPFPPRLLPNPPLAKYLLNTPDPDSGKLTELFNTLDTGEKTTFAREAPETIADLILPNLSFTEALYFAPVKGEKTILANQIKKLQLSAESSKIWQLYDQAANLPQPPDLTIVYDALDNPNLPIPHDYERLAQWLSDKGHINRSVPRTAMATTLEDIRSIGKLGHIGNIQSYLKDNPFNATCLIALVKLPWDHYAWEALFEALSEEQRQKLPGIIKEVLDKAPTTLLDYKQWWQVVYQYILFLIITDKTDHLTRLLNTVQINKDTREYLKNLLIALMPTPNAAVELFNNNSSFLKDMSSGRNRYL